MAAAGTKPAASRPEDTRMGGMGHPGAGMLGAHPSPHRSPLNKTRRSSYEATNFSPHDGSWSGFGFGLDGGAMAGNEPGMVPFFNLQTASSVPPSASIPSASFSPHASWPTQDNSGECTPTAGFDPSMVPNFPGPSAGFEPVQIAAQHSMSTAFSPTSPQNNKETWFGDGVEFSQMQSQKSPMGQAFVTNTSVLRRDGIRKKNARFEIPAERNLRTIDQLISQSTDDHEIKELKQQKRLLRNRQAALDSRQRKKQHTERLEEEKKHYASVIGDLEEALQEQKIADAEFQRQKDQWLATQQQYQSYIEHLRMEKDELLRRHTIESGELRKKNAILMEQMQRMEHTAMSTAPSSAGFSNEFSDFDGLAMHSWDDFSLSNDFSLEADARTEMASMPPGAPKKELAKATPTAAPATAPMDEKAITSSFLLMLLLCGAWVVSNSSKAPSDLLPSVPDEMKTASAAVLDTLYKDSGIQLQTPRTGRSPRAGAERFELASLSASSLDSLHHRLVAPSDQQLHEQAFSLTPRQYNDIVGAYPPNASGFPQAQSVGDALAAEAPSAEKGSSAHAYTRSLLRGMVSSQVLQDFARMVAKTQSHSPAKNTGSTQTWKSEPVD